jgi:hypothetical protein
LLRHTPKSHKDYELLNKSLSRMKSVAAYVNERKRENENLQSVLRIQSLLINYTVWMFLLNEPFFVALFD